MFGFGKKPDAAEQNDKPQPPAILLVLQVDDFDWPTLFKDVKLRNGRAVQVVQTGWKDIQVHCDTYSSARCIVEVMKLAPTASRSGNKGFIERKCMTVKPDFVLVRNEVVTNDFNGKGLLNGFLFADIPSVNSLESILLNCERPVMQGYLHRMNRTLGDAFPVMPQHYASSHSSFMYGYTFPAVVKVGSAHAGVGKMRINDHHQMSDFRSVLAMMPEQSCFAEPFVEGEADLRIQKIGTHYRAFRRVGVSGEWKTNTGTSLMEELPLSDRWRDWVDAAAEMCGGLDILSVDAIVEHGTGKEYIMEVNGTSTGLHPDCAEEDNQHILELVVRRMNEALCV